MLLKITDNKKYILIINYLLPKELIIQFTAKIINLVILKI
jgi:hypothetical protein